MKFRKTVSFVLSAVMSVVFTASASVAYIESQSVSYAVDSVKVEKHTQEEIRQYIEAHPFDFKSHPTYTVQPSITEPYEIGQLDSETEEKALNALNCMRYIAGLSEVTLDAEYSKYAQAAAFVNKINNSLTHYPEQPAGVPNDIYWLGKTGASNSNLCSGKYNLADSIINGYMDDSDSSNISAVGHRRWCLYPITTKTGFGSVDDLSAMFAVNIMKSRAALNICWPAQNMPTEYFRSSAAWSISLNKILSEDDVSVNLVRSSDKQEWNFSTSSADGDFYVDNFDFGEPGCIIFRPTDISYHDGDKFDVKITTEDNIIEYSVDFFSLYGEEEAGFVGDIDNSGKIDVFDVIELKKGIDTHFEDWSDKKMARANVNNDVMVGVSDLVFLCKYVLGQIKNFD